MSGTSSRSGAFFVGIAALLWATDTIFRYPLVHQHALDPTFIVFVDHLICLLGISLWIFLRHRADLFRLTLFQWIAVAFIGAGGSAIATVLFTASFNYVNPSVTILLQKLQPVFVVLLAFVFLGERLKRAMFIWAPIALLAGLAISFPDFHFEFAKEISSDSKGTLLALSAAGIWAVATVLGKAVLRALNPMVVTFWRFAFGLVTLFVMLVISHAPTPFALIFRDREVGRSFLYLGLIVGLLAMIFYYQGMKRTQASVTTFMELIFPVAAVSINAYFLDMPITLLQGGAGIVLLFAVSKISGSQA